MLGLYSFNSQHLFICCAMRDAYRNLRHLAPPNIRYFKIFFVVSVLISLDNLVLSVEYSLWCIACFWMLGSVISLI
jgi:hypothetical protein